MYLRRNGRSSGSTDRGQTAVLGVVLLIGMVATISLSFFLVAGETVTTVEQQAEEERVEGAFVELSQQMHTVSSNDDISRTMDLDIGQNGAVVREETGSISVTSDALEDDAISDLSIGTIEYESEGGTVLAYEAGAVFRENGNETQVVSSPSIHYDVETGTLTLPVVTATGEERLGSGDVTFAHGETKTFDNADVVEDESVEITIESDYYRGWEAFFRNQAGDAAVREVDHENQTVEVQVGYLDPDEAFEDGIVYSEEFDGFDNAGIDNDTITQGSMPELDPVIDEMVTDVENGDMESEPLPTTAGEVADNGTYYHDGDLEIDSELAFDISEGNTTLIVDGTVTVTDTLRAKTDGSDHELKIYSTDNFAIDDGTVTVDDGNAAQLQVYGTSDMHIGIHPGEFEGTIYAPRDEEWGDTTNEVFEPGCTQQLCMQANTEVKGAFVTSSVYVQSASVDMEYDSALAGNDIDLYPDKYELPPQLTYLNVAKHEVVVEQD